MKRLLFVSFSACVLAIAIAVAGFSSAVYAGSSVCKENAVTGDCIKEKERVVADAQAEVTRIEAQLKTAKVNLGAAQQELQRLKTKKIAQEDYDGPRK